ncbi:Protein neuralized-like protein, partial [Dinothrombium tinctorium]
MQSYIEKVSMELESNEKINKEKFAKRKKTETFPPVFSYCFCKVMRFNNCVFGANVIVTDNGSAAHRANNRCFCDGIVFSESQLPLNKPISVEVRATDTQWKGSLIVGSTSKDPISFVSEKSLLKYSFPFGLCFEDKVWLKPLPIAHSTARFILLLTLQRELIAWFNNENVIRILSDLPADPLWLIFDLFGNIGSVRFVETDCTDKQIPEFILSMGPNASEEFEKACRNSSLPFNSGRLFFIGPLGAGKSSFKRALLGLSVEEEESKLPLEKNLSCFSDKYGEWTNNSSKVKNCEIIEDQMNDALAFNIAKSLIKKREGTPEDTPSCNPSDLMKSALRFSNKKIQVSEVNDADFNEMVVGLSESIKEKVRQYLSQFEENQEQERSEFNVNKNKIDNRDYVKYNFWDFSGNAIYFITNQLLLSSFAIYLLVIDINEDLDTVISQTDENIIQ